MMFYKGLVVVFSFLLMNFFRISSGKNLTTNFESGLNVTDGLSVEIKEVWCNGINYTSLCQKLPKMRLCISELIRLEYFRIKNDNSLYDYNAETLADKVQAIKCDVEKTPDSGFKMLDLIIIIFLVFSIILIIRIFRRLKKFGNLIKPSNDTVNGVSVNEVTSTTDN